MRIVVLGRSVLALALAMTPVVAAAQGPALQSSAPQSSAPQDSSPTLAIHAGRLIDPASGRTLTDQIIVVQGDRITAVGPAGGVKPPAGARLIDLSGDTVLPGLIDVHTHLTSNPEDSGANSLTISTPQETIIGVVNAKRTLEAGFTAVRNVSAEALLSARKLSKPA